MIDELVVSRQAGSGEAATIQLLQGDLSALPPEHAVDALVVSAFPNSYTPNPGTLFASLEARGLDMQEVARHKEEDERSHLGCWLSTPLPPEQSAALHIARVICFEPRYPAFVSNSGIDPQSIEDTVGFVFRCLNNFVIPDNRGRRFDIASVAMPLLATGNQRVPVAKMLPRLLEAAIFWLEQGLPVRQLKIVAFSGEDAAEAARVFGQVKLQRHLPDGRAPQAERPAVEDDWRGRLASDLGRQIVDSCARELQQRLMTLARPDERPVLRRVFGRMMEVQVPAPSDVPARTRSDGVPDESRKYDVFVSYAHKQDSEVLEFVEALRQAAPNLRMFFDRSSIAPGEQWIRAISEAVGRSRVFVAVLSPDYSASPVCWDEFQCAKLREYTTGRSVIKTVRLYSDEALPPIMGIHSYIDCVEGDLARLRDAAAAVLGGRIIGDHGLD